jgi:hypothetical protein
MPGKAKMSAVYVIFGRGGTGRGEQQLVCGPYFSVEIFQGQMAGIDCRDYQICRIASLGPDGWHVHDGLGDGAPAYDSAIVCSRLPRSNRDPDRPGPMEAGG